MLTAQDELLAFIPGEFPPALALSCSAPPALCAPLGEEDEGFSCGCCLPGGWDEALGASRGHGWCGRLSRGSPALSPELRRARAGASRQGRSRSSSSLPGEPERAAGAGMPRQGHTDPCATALCCFLEHSELAPVMPRSQTRLSQHIPGAAAFCWKE